MDPYLRDMLSVFGHQLGRIDRNNSPTAGLMFVAVALLVLILSRVW